MAFNRKELAEKKAKAEAAKKQKEDAAKADSYILDVPGLPVTQFSKKGVKAMTKKNFMDVYVPRIGENYAEEVYTSICGKK